MTCLGVIGPVAASRNGEEIVSLFLEERGTYKLFTGTRMYTLQHCVARSMRQAND